MQIRREGDTAVTDDKPQDNVPPPPGGAPAPEKDLPGEDTRSHLAELSAKLIAMNAAAAGQAARATSAHVSSCDSSFAPRRSVVAFASVERLSPR